MMMKAAAVIILYSPTLRVAGFGSESLPDRSVFYPTVIHGFIRPACESFISMCWLQLPYGNSKPFFHFQASWQTFLLRVLFVLAFVLGSVFLSEQRSKSLARSFCGLNDDGYSARLVLRGLPPFADRAIVEDILHDVARTVWGSFKAGVPFRIMSPWASGSGLGELHFRTTKASLLQKESFTRTQARMQHETLCGDCALVGK